MPQKMQEQGMLGQLLAMAPLANPYVPFQQENPPVYEAKKGIVRGTLFPGLDLPFMGMINQKDLTNTPLAELQTMAFAIRTAVLRDNNRSKLGIGTCNLYGILQFLFIDKHTLALPMRTIFPRPSLLLLLSLNTAVRMANWVHPCAICRNAIER